MSESVDGISANIKQLYIDPLIAYAKCHFNQKKDVQESIDADFLISSYIPKMDEEIFSNPPLNLSDEEIKIWNEEKYSEIFSELLTQGRAISYSIVQFNSLVHHQIFSEFDRMDWVLDEKTKLPIGIKVVKDWLHPSVGEEGKAPLIDVIWGKNQIYLFKYAEGNNKSIFAKADLNQAMWTCAVTHRQVQSALDIIASKPEFYFVKYGQPTPEQRTALMNAISDASVLQALGASPQVCTGIDVIQYNAYKDLLDCLADKRRMFAGLTRLPLAYFNGERTSGSGTGGSAENMVERKINKRKIILFNKIKPLIVQIYKDRHNMDVSDIELDLQEEESIVENDNPITDENTDKVNSNNDPQSPKPAEKKGWLDKLRGK